MTTSQLEDYQHLVQLMVAAEQSTSRKEGRHIINEATKLRERMNNLPTGSALMNQG